MRQTSRCLPNDVGQDQQLDDPVDDTDLFALDMNNFRRVVLEESADCFRHSTSHNLKCGMFNENTSTCSRHTSAAVMEAKCILERMTRACTTRQST